MSVKYLERRTVYGLGAILFLVLQIDFWIAPWHSHLQFAALIGSNILANAYVADLVFRKRATIWRIVKRLRRD